MSERSGRRSRVTIGAAAALGTTVLFADGAAAAPFEVTNLNDSGVGSLRAAVEQAGASPADDTITFQSGLSGTIALTSGQLTSPINTGALAIEGPGASRLTITAGDASRILYANGGSGQALDISGLTLEHGSAVLGGAIYETDRNLTIADSVLRNNHASGKGGATWTDGFNSTLTITNSTLTGNSAGGDGGAIYNEDTAIGLSPAHLDHRLGDHAEHVGR